MSDAAHVTDFYKRYHDEISTKRYNSPYWIRRYAHRLVYERALARISSGQSVLDVGCGEGVLSLLIAERGACVTGTDISSANIASARAEATRRGSKASFVIGNAQDLAFADSSFDVVVSSHVIEHLPEPACGLRELYRVTRDRALIAMPTCLSPASWALLGGDSYWKLSRRSAIAIPLGLLRTVRSFLSGEEGPQEGYAGRGDLPHVWRFPWVMTRMVREAGFTIDAVEAGPLLLPYAAEYLPFLRALQVALDRCSGLPILRYAGFGTHIVARKAR